MGEKIVGVPSVKGIGDSFKDFGIGALGGLIFLIAYRLFGGLGIIAAPLIAGSMVKGDRGQMLSTIAGFMLLAAGALSGVGVSNGGGANEETI
jgi:hypothetical protein